VCTSLGIYLREELRYSSVCPAKKYSRFLDDIERRMQALINDVEDIDADNDRSLQPALDAVLSSLYDQAGLDRLERDGHRIARWGGEILEVRLLMAGNLRELTYALLLL
jgi:hypothetical protein